MKRRIGMNNLDVASFWARTTCFQFYIFVEFFRSLDLCVLFQYLPVIQWWTLSHIPNFHFYDGVAVTVRFQIQIMYWTLRYTTKRRWNMLWNMNADKIKSFMSRTKKRLNGSAHQLNGSCSAFSCAPHSAPKFRENIQLRAVIIINIYICKSQYVYTQK